LKSIMRWIERFCHNHPRFGIRNLMLYIVIGNVLVFGFEMMNTSQFSLYYLLSFDFGAVMRGEIWRIFTFVFVPEHINMTRFALSMLFYYFAGNLLENKWGTAKFTIFYVMGILVTIIYGIIIYFILGFGFPVNATYVNLSMFFAVATLFPDLQLLLFFLIPVKITWLALLEVAAFAYAMIVLRFPMNLLPLVAIFNYLLFFADMLISLVHPRKLQRGAKTINYKRAARKVRKEQENRPFRYQCGVCGKTDAEYPNLEFRYCSKCAGYRCFCEEHINNHIHFTE